MRQNDNPIAQTMYPGVAVNGIGNGAWNSPDSLSKQSADAKIDTRLFDFGLLLNPTNDLELKGKVRHYETGEFHLSTGPVTH